MNLPQIKKEHKPEKKLHFKSVAYQPRKPWAGEMYSHLFKFKIEDEYSLEISKLRILFHMTATNYQTCEIFHIFNTFFVLYKKKDLKMAGSKSIKQLS